MYIGSDFVRLCAVHTGNINHRPKVFLWPLQYYDVARVNQVLRLGTSRFKACYVAKTVLHTVFLHCCPFDHQTNSAFSMFFFSCNDCFCQRFSLLDWSNLCQFMISTNGILRAIFLSMFSSNFYGSSPCFRCTSFGENKLRYWPFVIKGEERRSGK